MKLFLGKFFGWFFSTRFWPWFSKVFVSKAHLPIFIGKLFGLRRIPSERWEMLVDRVKKHKEQNPGALYAFASSDSLSLATFLIKMITGENKTHAGFLDPDSPWWTLEMRAGGFESRHIKRLMEDSTSLIIVAYRLPSLENYSIAVDELRKLEYLGPDYDFEQFLETKDKFYCSELVYFVLNGLLDIVLVPAIEFGRRFYSPGQVATDGERIIEYGKDCFIG